MCRSHESKMTIQGRVFWGHGSSTVLLHTRQWHG